MKITPIDLRKKKFKKGFRGYDCEDVSAFLASLSKEWERLQAECRSLVEERNRMKRDLEKLRDVEATMFKALKNAENAGTDVVQKANTHADIQIRETKMRAESMLQKAKERAIKILEETRRESYKILQNLQQEIRSILYTYESVKEEKEHLVRDIKLLVEGVLKKAGTLNEKVQKSRLQEKVSKAESFQLRVEDRVAALQEEVDQVLISPVTGELKASHVSKRENFFDDLS